MKKEGSSQVRRQLDFREKIFTKKTFYIDIREDDLKKRIYRRIKDLGGQIEEFLCKDVHVLLTDSNTARPRRDSSQLSPDPESRVSVPLSRGKALLLKATKQSSCQNSVKGTDVIQNAINFGVKVEKAKDFLKSTHKHAQKLKQAKALESDDIDGITPLQWKNADKENYVYLKVEDESQVYRPFLKHFKEKFPKVRYDEDFASPFDKGVVLCKTTEKKNNNRYSTKRKPTVTLGCKGGFCEACDYWYRCSLREHLNSTKHQKFVQSNTNFEQLDQIIRKMPSIGDFMSKFNIENEKIKVSKETDVAVYTDIDSVKDCSLGREKHGACDFPVEMSVSSNSVLSCDKGTVSSGSAMMVSPTPADQVKLNCENTEVLMEVDTPVAQKTVLDECSKDSGTGPEIKEEMSLPIEFVQIVGDNKLSGNITDEDSAFQHDLSSNSPTRLDMNRSDGSVFPSSTSTTYGINSVIERAESDNAVFLDLTARKNNIPTPEATSNVRRKLSAIVISDKDHDFHNENLDSNNKENESIIQPPVNEAGLSTLKCREIEHMQLNSPVSFNLNSPVTSPKSNILSAKLDFADIAANWMKDMSVKGHIKNEEMKDVKAVSTVKKKNLVTDKDQNEVTFTLKNKRKSRKKSLKRNLMAENSSPFFTLFKSKCHQESSQSSESDFELPQLPVLNSNVAKQRLIEDGRKLQSSPLQYCSREEQNPRGSSTCTKSRMKLFKNRRLSRHRKSLAAKQLDDSPMCRNQSGSKDSQTKLPQYFSEKNTIFSSSQTSDQSPMILDSLPQPVPFEGLQTSYSEYSQKTASHDQSSTEQYEFHVPRDSQIQMCSSHIMHADSKLSTNNGSQFVSESGNCSSQVLPDHSSQSPRCLVSLTQDSSEINSKLESVQASKYQNKNSIEMEVPKHLSCDLQNDTDTEEYTLLTEDMKLDVDTPKNPQSSTENVYDSDTENYVPYSPRLPVLDENSESCISLPSENLNSINELGGITNGNEKNHGDSSLAPTTPITKPCSELSFSIESILSGMTGKNRTPSTHKTTLPGFGTPSISSSHCDANPVSGWGSEFCAKSVEKKKGRRKRHSSKRNKPGGCDQYYVCPQGGTKIKLCRVMVTPVEQKSNLKTFWKVRKAGNCRLLFSAEKNKDFTHSAFISKKREGSLDQDQLPNKKRRKLSFVDGPIF